MKVLIIEDNEYKLDKAMRILQHFNITDCVHVNNYTEAIVLCYDCLNDTSQIDEFDLIILDIQFYQDNPEFNSNSQINSEAGYLFLYNLTLYEVKKDVIIFSSEKDYSVGLKKFLLPEFKDFIELTDNPNLPRTFHSIQSEYEDYIKRNKKIFESIDFVIGHAHNPQELEVLLCNWINT